jgi:hypothetical protein
MLTLFSLLLLVFSPLLVLCGGCDLNSTPSQFDTPIFAVFPFSDGSSSFCFNATAPFGAFQLDIVKTDVTGLCALGTPWG